MAQEASCGCQVPVWTPPEVRDYRECAVEYENGIADVLSSMLPESTIIERQVKVPSRRARAGNRSIEILAHGQIFGIPNATLAVDCKCRNRNLRVSDVATFIELLEDISTDLGLLVTTHGASRLATTRARSVRGIRIATIPLRDLLNWRAAGTLCQNVRVPASDVARATNALRRVGMRVMAWPDIGNGYSCLEVYRHYGKEWPESTDWDHHCDAIGQALHTHAIEHQWCESSLDCGTTRSIDVTIDGRRAPYGIGARNEQEAEENLRRLAEHIDVPHHRLAYVGPKGWPDEWPFGPLMPLI